MSEFITNSDPIYSHDWKPGRVQAVVANFKERCGRLATLTADIMEQDAMSNGGIGSELWLTLKSIMDALLKNNPVEAFQIAQENNLYIFQLEELASEDAITDPTWGEKADRLEQMYPHQN